MIENCGLPFWSSFGQSLTQLDNEIVANKFKSYGDDKYFLPKVVL